MTDEEYIMYKLDTINRNSTYGLVDAEMLDRLTMEACNDLARIWNVGPGEIRKMVEDYIKGVTREFKPLQPYPKPPIYIEPVKVKSLKEKIDNYKRRKKEMKATSVQKIKNVKDVCFDISNDPIERESKLTIVASTNDDIFAFEFEGPDLLQSCKRAGLFTGWEKDQKIRELEKDLGRWKKEAADCLRLRDEAQKEAYKLKKENEKYEEKIKKLEHDDMLDKDAADYWSKEHDNLLERFAKLQVENEKLKDKLENVEPFRSLERTIKEKQQLKEEYEDKIDDLQRKYNLEREANEAQHKFFREYAGKGTEIEFNYVIDDVNEVSYVIVDKEEYKALKNIQNNVRLHGMDFTPDELVDRIKELEKLKTPTIENFADEEPSSRRDILRCAEKCVCGKREQDYGTPESNFQLIADLWNDYLFNSSKNDITITHTDVAMLMALMKIARIRNGGGSGDSFVDLAGYAACGGEIWHSNKETNGDSSQETN